MMDKETLQKRTKQMVIRVIHMSNARQADLIQEADEILAMTVASIKTLRKSQIANCKSQIANRKSQIVNPND